MNRLWKNIAFWVVAFGGIILLTQDYLFIEWNPGIGLLGLPNWLPYFLLLHIAFIGVFYLFIKKSWREEGRD